MSEDLKMQLWFGSNMALVRNVLRYQQIIAIQNKIEMKKTVIFDIFQQKY